MKRLLAQIDGVLRGARGEQGLGGVLRLVGFTVLFGGLYGGVMGSYGGIAGDRGWQIVISAAKVPLLLVGTFAISLPSFFVLNTLLAVRSDFPTVLRALTSSQAGLTIILAALAPYTLLWYASFSNYQVAILFNGLIFGVSTCAAHLLMLRWYRPLIARHPQHRFLLLAWLILYSFVGIQMGWVLRPFIGLPDAPVQFFRTKAWDNAYVIVAQMFLNALKR